MKELGGTLICHNALQYDYCIEASLESLAFLCDEVIVLDCESTDGTYDLVKKMQKTYHNIRVFKNKWEVAPNYERLAILTNIARDKLDSGWHFNLQADEVVHEKSIPIIRKAIDGKSSFGGKSFSARRLNFWGDDRHYFKPTHKNPPVSPEVIRLASPVCNAVRDAESLSALNLSRNLVESIQIFHYGFIRDRVIMLDKIIDMQQWFGFGVDKRVVGQKELIGVFNPWEFVSKADLAVFNGDHPKFAKKWLDERRGQWVY